MWTDEQLRQTTGEVTAELDRLYNLERPLTKEEKKFRSRMQMRKYVLEKIKEAKDRGLTSDEMYNSTMYGLLVPWGEKHPFLMFLVSRWIRGRWWGLGVYDHGIRAKRQQKEANDQR